jgi:hypothetical protein
MVSKCANPICSAEFMYFGGWQIVRVRVHFIARRQRLSLALQSMRKVFKIPKTRRREIELVRAEQSARNQFAA